MKYWLRTWRCFSLVLLLGLGGPAAIAQGTIEVVRADEDFPPFEKLSQGKLEGVHVELVEAAAKSLGIKVNWTSLPWKRALRMVETGQADAVTYISRTPEREAWAIFVEGNLLSLAEARFITRREDAGHIVFDGDLERLLSQHTFIAVRGFQFGRADLDKAKRLEANNTEDLVRMLRAGHAPLGLVNWGQFRRVFEGKPDYAHIASLKPAVASAGNYIAFSAAREHADLAQRFAQAISSFKQSAEYAQMVKRYQLEP